MLKWSQTDVMVCSRFLNDAILSIMLVQQMHSFFCFVCFLVNVVSVGRIMHSVKIGYANTISVLCYFRSGPL